MQEELNFQSHYVGVLAWLWEIQFSMISVRLTCVHAFLKSAFSRTNKINRLSLTSCKRTNRRRSRVNNQTLCAVPHLVSRRHCWATHKETHLHTHSCVPVNEAWCRLSGTADSLTAPPWECETVNNNIYLYIYLFCWPPATYPSFYPPVIFSSFNLSSDLCF